MAERTIKIVSFVWHKTVKDYNDEDVSITADSKRGEVVDLPANWIRYGESMGAFITPEDVAQEEAVAVDVSAMTEDELVDWVSERTIPEVVTVAKNNPSLISSILAAENIATGNDPRTGVLEGLAMVIGGDVPAETGPPSPPTSEDDGSGSTPEGDEEPPVVEDEAIAAAEKLGVDTSKVEGTGDNGEVTADDVKEYFDEEMADATDGAIELAEEEDTYLADVSGTGKDGRITKDDVQAYVDAAKAAAAE